MISVYSPLNSLRAPFNPERCAANVWDRGRSSSNYQCRSAGAVEEEGYRWCRTHAPSAERARQAASDAKYKADRAVQDRKYAIQAQRVRVVEAAKAWAIEVARNRVVEATDAWANATETDKFAFAELAALDAAVAELERLEAEAQP